MDLRNIIRKEDAIDGRAATAFYISEGKRMLLFHLKKWESKVDIEKTEMQRLGTTATAHRYNGVKGSWTAELYYVSDLFRKLVLDYMNTGKMFTFDIQTTNDDKNSKAGRHTVIHRNCTIDSVILSKIDVSSTALEESVSGTFESAEMPEAFKDLEGMN